MASVAEMFRKFLFLSALSYIFVSTSDFWDVEKASREWSGTKPFGFSAYVDGVGKKNKKGFYSIFFACAM